MTYAADSDQSNVDDVGHDTPRHARFHPNDAFGGYSFTSLIIHGVSIFCVLIVAVQMIRGGYQTPAPPDAAIAAFFLFHVWWRIKHGFPRTFTRPLFVAFVYRLSMVVMLFSLGVFAIAGLTLAWFSGETLTAFGYPVFPFENNALPFWQSLAEITYRASVNAFITGTIVQMIALIHSALSPARVALKRIVTPVKHGK
ncbi:MAG: hypothetical protein AAFR13_03860 [Pseudomonadota bacterium]